MQKKKSYKTPLYLATEKNNLDIVQLLLEKESIKVDNGTDKIFLIGHAMPLFNAIKNENIEMVKLLLSTGKIDINFINILKKKIL